MTGTFEGFAELDRTIQDPSRLAILMALRYTDGGGFSFLQKLTKLSKGNLSNHLAKLEEAEMVEVERRFVGKKPLTTVRLTEEGTSAIDEHWERVDALRKDAREWREEDSEQSPKRYPGETLGGTRAV